MRIDMKGYEVVYNGRVYQCVAVEPILYFDDDIEYMDRLRVFVIDHEASFDMLEDSARHFSFLKEDKVA